MGELSGDLAAARRLLPEGSKVQGEVVWIPKPGVIGLFASLPGGLTGFVDVLTLPRDADAWPAVGMRSDFEVMQHQPGQVRLWPLDPRFRGRRFPWGRDGTDEAWCELKERHPAGSALRAEVVAVYPSNQEYVVRFADGDDLPWSCAFLPWTRTRPRAGSVAWYQVTARLEATRRIMVSWHSRLNGWSRD